MQLPARPGGGHLLEERQKLLMAVPRLALVQDVPGGDLQGGEQGGGPVPDIVVGALLRSIQPHPADWLGTLQA
jgi:hypothetical protein